ncbi:shikimate dehydrogenase family protein [Micromonospora sp. SD19]|uniref:shikimate dehydrogenase family protein n=1 Tax=Micromonospora parva TaxID=1464048 RepID=UPI00366C5723
MVDALAITGSTRIYALLGDPVAQVRAPSLLNPLLAERSVDAVLIPVHVAPTEFAQVVGGLRRIGNLHGMLVTVPHKAAALALADRASPGAILSASANALRREPDGAWLADTFDGVGFVRGLGNAGHTPKGKRVCLVGAGGAGSAIAVALLEAGAAALDVVDLDPGRLGTLVDRLAPAYPGRVTGATRFRPDEVDIAVNATPLGMRHDDPLPFDPARLAPGTVVADIIMSPATTPLLAAARSLGHQVHPGIHMLANQLDSYLDFFGL